MMRARETFWGPKDRRVIEGQLVRDDDWILQGREHLFDPVTVTTPAENSSLVQELLDRIGKLETAAAGGGKTPASKKEKAADS